jgi:hypothetical protein
VEVLLDHKETLDPEARAQNIHEVVGQVHQKLDHFEKTNFSFLEIGRAQKFTDDFVPIQTESSDINRQLVDAAFARLGLVSMIKNLADAPEPTSKASLNTSTNGPQGVTDSIQSLPSDIQVNLGKSTQVSASSRPDALFAKPESAGLRLYRSQASLTQRKLKVPYKQMAVALLTVVFASPIYTQPAKSRVVAGPLVAVHQLAPEMFEQRQALGPALMDTFQSR